MAWSDFKTNQTPCKPCFFCTQCVFFTFKCQAVLHCIICTVPKALCRFVTNPNVTKNGHCNFAKHRYFITPYKIALLNRQLLFYSPMSTKTWWLSAEFIILLLPLNDLNLSSITPFGLNHTLSILMGKSIVKQK